MCSVSRTMTSIRGIRQGFRVKVTPGFARTLSVCSPETWRKAIPGRSHRIGKCAKAWQRQLAERWAQWRWSIELRCVGQGSSLKNQACFQSCTQPIYKLLSMSYLQVVSDLSRSVEVDGAFKNPNISAQKIRSLPFWLPAFQSQFRQRKQKGFHQIYTALKDKLLEFSQEIKTFYYNVTKYNWFS